MNVKKLLLMMAAVAGTLALCQCSSEAPPPPGTVRMVDQQAIALMQEARAREEKNDLSGAIKKYRRVVEKHPLSREAPQARFRMAELHEARKEPADAFDQYQKLIDRHPDSPLYRQAMARQKEMAFGAASGALTNRVLWMFDVRMDPTNVTEWLKHVRDNAPYAPTAPQAMNVLGNYLAARGRMKEAIEAYQNLVDNYPNSPLAPTAQLQIATLYRQAAADGDRNHVNVARAQEAYEDYLQRYPNSARAGAARADLAAMKRELVAQQLEVAEYYLTKMKDTDAAIFCYQEVVSKGSINPAAAARAKARLKELRVTSR